MLAGVLQQSCPVLSLGIFGVTRHRLPYWTNICSVLAMLQRDRVRGYPRPQLVRED